MDNYKLENILSKLVSASKNFKIDWLKVPGSDNSFKTKIGTTEVYITFITNRYYLIVNNAEGSEIGRLTGGAYDYQISELYDLAKRKALKIDESLNDLDNILSKI